MSPDRPGATGRAAPAADRDERPDVAGPHHASAGEDPVRLVAVRAGRLDVGELHEAVRDPRCGAIVTYEGTPRDVAALEYEAYAPMVERTMRDLAAAAAARHGCPAIAVVHRTGHVPAGEPSIVLSAASPHRAAAFAACRELLDAVKARAPIWKTEVAADGTRTPVAGELPR